MFAAASVALLDLVDFWCTSGGGGGRVGGGGTRNSVAGGGGVGGLRSTYPLRSEPSL